MSGLPIAILHITVVTAVLEIPSELNLLKEIKQFVISAQEILSEPCQIILVNGLGDGNNSRDVANWMLPKTTLKMLVENFDTSGPHAGANSLKVSFVRTLEDFNQKMEGDASFKVFEVRRKIVFIICNPVRDGLWVRQMLEDLWKNSILNFLMVFYTTKIEIVSYNPFLSDTGEALSHQDYSSAAVVNSKKLSNLHNYRLKLTVFNEYPRIVFEKSIFNGNDIRLIMKTMRVMKASTEIIKSENSSWAGIFDDLTNNGAAFSLIDLFYMPLDIFDIDLGFTRPLAMDGFVIIVPTAGTIPEYLHLFLTFPLNVWATLFSTVSIFSLTMHVMERVFEKLYGHKNPPITSLELLRIFVNSPSEDFTDAVFSRKFLLMLFIFFSMLISVAFHSSLTSALVTPRSFKDIHTLQDLEENGIKIMMNYFFSDMVPPTSKLHRQFVNFTQQEIMDSIMSGNTNYGYGITSKATAHFIAGFANNLHRSQLFHVVEEPLIPSFRAHMCPRSSPYLEKVNELMLAVHENGLMMRKGGFVNHQVNFLEYGEVLVATNNFCSHTALTLEHLQTAFFILIAGGVISSLVFAGEIFVRRRKCLSKVQKKYLRKKIARVAQKNQQLSSP